MLLEETYKCNDCQSLVRPGYVHTKLPPLTKAGFEYRWRLVLALIFLCPSVDEYPSRTCWKWGRWKPKSNMKTGQNKNARRVARTPGLQNALSHVTSFSLLLSQLSYPGYISTLVNVHYNYYTMTSEVFQTHRLLTSYE